MTGARSYPGMSGPMRAWEISSTRCPSTEGRSPGRAAGAHSRSAARDIGARSAPALLVLSCVSAERPVGIRARRNGGILADDEPAALDDETDIAGRDADDEWPELSPLELAVCLADGQTRPPEQALEATPPAA